MYEWRLGGGDWTNDEGFEDFIRWVGQIVRVVGQHQLITREIRRRIKLVINIYYEIENLYSFTLSMFC